MGKTVTIGTWLEPEARTIDRCPSYYAADTETLRIVPGKYPLRVTFETGYTVPMPYWLLATVDTVRESGRLYSGFGGVNFASTELAPGEPVRHTFQCYAYQLEELVAKGHVVVDPRFGWLVGGPGAAVWKREGAPKSWADVDALAAAPIPAPMLTPTLAHATAVVEMKGAE